MIRTSTGTAFLSDVFGPVEVVAAHEVQVGSHGILTGISLGSECMRGLPSYEWLSDLYYEI